jgi:putative (di)nucleoside polyphosphate hydrolase
MSETLLSCGVLIVCREAELLLCHSTGSPRWDIPKGLLDPGETPLQAAVRETFEEAGLALDADSLLDLGRHAYLRGKDLHLYGLLSERFDVAACRCTSFFVDARGRERPEVDGFEWTPFDRVFERTGKSLAALLRGRVPLHDLLKRLLAEPA